ncbi:MAG: ABC transporter permease [Tidjanibacter sp.]|nr:ABC transporter permease [Tidjanibacter sp.]
MGKIGIIAGREFNERVRKKSFIITTILMPLFLVAMMFIPMLMVNMKSNTVREIYVVDDSGVIADKLQDSGTLRFIPSDMPLDEIKEQSLDIFGVLVIGNNVVEGGGAQLYTYDSSTIDIESEISTQIKDIIETEKLKGYNIENLSEILASVETSVPLSVKQFSESGEAKDSSSVVAIVAAYIFGFLIYMFVFLYGGMVMQGVIEEKSNKVLEVMVSSVKPFQLMMGKILGIASVALTQLLIWVVFIVVVGGGLMSLLAGDMIEAAQAMSSGMPMDMSAMSGMVMDADMAAAINTLTDPAYLFRLIGGFIVYFIGGYLLYAAMFAAVGSAVDNEKDTQNLQTPISMPLILGLFVMLTAMQDPNSPLAVWCSIIPFTSPIVMVARLPYGVPAWELWTSIGVLFASFLAIVWLAGKVYRVGIFMYGKKPTFKELFKWMKYKM